jgi:tRNA A37 threonylcarbamoyladenosine dehydratase
VINGSAVMVTAAAGMILASLVLRDICAGEDHG